MMSNDMSNDNKVKKFLDWVNADENLPTLEELEQHAHGDAHDDHGASSEHKTEEEPESSDDELSAEDDALAYPDAVLSEEEQAGQAAPQPVPQAAPQPPRGTMIQLTKTQKARLNRTRLFSNVVSLLCACGIIAVLLVSVVYLPQFGGIGNPTINEVYTRYVEKGTEETGAINIVAAMILDYRAFDTLGESIVLFTATMGVIMLLRTPRESSDSTGSGKEGRHESEET